MTTALDRANVARWAALHAPTLRQAQAAHAEADRRIAEAKGIALDIRALGQEGKP